MIIPVGKQNEPEELVQIDKLANGSVKTTQLMGVQYVPLVGGDFNEL